MPRKIPDTSCFGNLLFMCSYWPRIPEVRESKCPLLALLLQTPSVYTQLLLVQELVDGCEHGLDFLSGVLIKFLEENITPKCLSELQSLLKILKVERNQILFCFVFNI